MAERSLTKPEIASQKRTLKLPPAIGDWTTYRPPKILVKKVKTGLYGFDRLSKSELHQVLLIHYRFIQEYFKRLKFDLRLGIEFFSAQVEQITYLNFLRTLSGPVVQGKLSLPDFHEGVQIFFDLNLANSIINHALGSRDLEPMNRSLTEAENTVFSTAFTEYLPKYVSAFEAVTPTPAFNLIGSPDVTLDPSINTSSTFVIFSAEASLNDNPPGKIIFGYLASTLKNLLDRYGEKTEAKPLNFSKLSAAALSKIGVPASAVLGKTNLLTSELNRLEVGDVVSLDTTTNSAATLMIGNFLKLLAQPGISNKKRSLRIAGFKEEEIQFPAPLEAAEKEKPVEEEKPPAEVELPKEEMKEEFPEEFPEEELSEEEEFPEEELSEEEEFAEEEFPEEEEFPKEGG